MKMHNLSRLIVICSCLFVTACNTATPEQYFDRTVLNSNMLVGFAGKGQLREMESPSATMGANGETVPLKRVDELNGKIKFIEDAFKKLKALKKTDDTKDMLKTSLALYEHVLPVYKREYLQLAKLYDDGAAKEQIQTLAQSIHDKYYLRYDELFNQLIGYGKVYAERHHIEVNWNVGG
jgi:hypothetical protein